MIKAGSDILFQEPNCDTRRLRRSIVTAVDGDSISIQFAAEPFDFEVDQEVLMYFNGKREFMQQMGRVTEIVTADAAGDAGESPSVDAPGATTFVLAPLGDPVSAESRQFYRVSTMSAGLKATVDGVSDLLVQDLSATGFAVIASKEYSLGETLDIEIAHEGDACHGIASVQSVREFGPGRIRYGMRAIEEDPHTSEFLEVLQRISLAVQRQQLQRT